MRLRPVSIVCSLLLAGCGHAPCVERLPSVQGPGLAWEVDAEPDPEPEPWQPVVAGECNLAGVPESLRAPVSDEDAETIRAAIEAWLSPYEHGLPVDLRGGVLFSKSANDVGHDFPLSLAERAQATRACGQQALWLEAHLRERMRTHSRSDVGEPVRCSGRVCCYRSFGEYDSAGGVVIGGPADRLVLVAGYQVADDGMMDVEYIGEQYEVVLAGFRNEGRGSCADPGGSR